MEPRVRIVWTLFKVMIALAILIPLGMLALGLVFNGNLQPAFGHGDTHDVRAELH